MALTVLEHKRWDGCSSTSTPDQILPGFYGLVQDWKFRGKPRFQHGYQILSSGILKISRGPFSRQMWFRVQKCRRLLKPVQGQLYPSRWGCPSWYRLRPGCTGIAEPGKCWLDKDPSAAESWNLCNTSLNHTQQLLDMTLSVQKKGSDRTLL